VSFVLWLWLTSASGRPLGVPVALGSYDSKARCQVALDEWLELGEGRWRGFCEEPLRQIPPR
jgi:hypothetical protein